MIRIRTNLLIYPAILFLLSCVIQDEAGPREDDVFVKYFGTSGEQRMVDMVVQSGGNVVMLGAQRIAEVGSTFDIVLIEADTFGNQVRESVRIDVGPLLGDSIYTAESPASIKLIDDGYLLLSTFSRLVEGSAVESSIFWAQLDMNFGIVQWDTINASGKNVAGRDIIQSADGNVIIVGVTDRPEENDHTINPGNQYFITKIYLADIDSVIFRKSYGYPNTDDGAVAVFELDNTNLAIIGSTEQVGNNGAQGNNIGIMILNDLATSLVSDEIYGVEINRIPINANDFPNGAVKISDGFMIVGTSEFGEQQRPFLIGVRESGALISTKSIESKWSSDNLDMTGRGLTITQTNDFVVTGAYTKFEVDDPAFKGLHASKNGEVLFMKTGQTGVEKPDYEHNYGLVGGNDVGEAIVTLPNGSIMIGGTADFGSNQTMMALMKMNDSGILQRQD